MKTKLQRVMCALFALMVCASVNAQTSGLCGASATWEYDSGTLTVSGSGAMADYTDALTDNPWNAYRGSISKVVIEDGITHIGNWAFMGCTSLTSVTIGESVETIGAEAFSNCTNAGFNALCLPNSVTSIGAFAFSNISNLQYLGCYASTPPTLGTAAFDATTPTAIYVPTDNLATYQGATGWSAFSAVITYPHGNCGNSDGDPTDAVTWSLDMGTKKLTLAGSGSIKTFGSQPGSYPWNGAAFNPEVNYAYTGIQTLIVGEGITNIPDYSFHQQGNLMSVSLPSTLKIIGNSAMGETAIWSICLPEGLETIGHYAFLMSTFESVSIPSTVTEIGEAAFAYGALTSIGCYAATPPTLGNDAFGDDLSGITDVYVQSAKVATYKAAAGWTDFGDKIKSPSGDCGTSATWTYEMATHTLTISGTGEIDSYNGWESAGMGGNAGGFNPDDFKGYPCGIKRVTIGEGITGIGSGAFYMEVGITNVTLPSTLLSIDTDAFGECENLSSITCKAITPPTLATTGDEDNVFYMLDANSDPVSISTLQNIYVPVGSEADYKAAAGWSTYAAKIQMPNTKVGDYSWVSFFDDSKAYEVDANTTVYKASLSGTTLTLTEIGGNQIITAGNAVIIKSTSAPVLTETATASTADFSGNELHGSASPVVSYGTLYALSYKSGTLGFFKVKNGTSIPAGKAYLSTADAAREYFEFTYGKDATSIESVASSHQTIANGQYYDMQSRKVSKPTKGLYIVNGKKVIVK